MIPYLKKTKKISVSFAAIQKNSFCLVGANSGFCISSCLGSFTYYVTQRRWVGGLQNVTIPMQLEKFYYAKALLEVVKYVVKLLEKQRYVICE